MNKSPAITKPTSKRYLQFHNLYIDPQFFTRLNYSTVHTDINLAETMRQSNKKLNR